MSVLGNQSTMGGMKARKCITDIKEKKTLYVPGANPATPDTFNFDFVAGEDVEQEDIFSLIGKPIVD